MSPSVCTAPTRPGDATNVFQAGAGFEWWLDNLYFESLRTEAKTCDKERLKAIYQEVADTIMARIAEL